jgi:hypothetical protein
MREIIELTMEPTDQVFSYYSDSDAKLLHLNVGLLARVRKLVPEGFRKMTLELTELEYELCIKHRGVEEPRVAALRGRDLREPGYIILTPPDTYKVVDGHHRMVRRYRGGIRSMEFWAAVPDIWTQCLMTCSPEDEAILAANLPDRVLAPASIPTRILKNSRA